MLSLLLAPGFHTLFTVSQSLQSSISFSCLAWLTSTHLLVFRLSFASYRELSPDTPSLDWITSMCSCLQGGPGSLGLHECGIGLSSTGYYFALLLNRQNINTRLMSQGSALFHSEQHLNVRSLSSHGQWVRCPNSKLCAPHLILASIAVSKVCSDVTEGGSHWATVSPLQVFFL